MKNERNFKITETFMNLVILEKRNPVTGDHFQSDHLWTSPIFC